MKFICNRCKKEFKSERALERHTKEIICMIQCDKCKRIFKTRRSYTRHKNSKYGCNPNKKKKKNIDFSDKIILEIRKKYIKGESQRRLNSIHNYTATQIKLAIKGIKRDLNEAVKLSHKLYPESYKHSEETKKKISKRRKEWLKKNRNKHNWRFNKESEPERILREWMENELSCYTIIAEYTPKNFERNFRLDFAVLEIKFDIEVNGNQHYNKDGSLVKYYKERQNYIESKGWKVINIPFDNILYNFENVKKELLELFEENKSFHFKRTKGFKEIKKQDKKDFLKEKSEKIKKLFFSNVIKKEICRKLNITTRELDKFIWWNKLKRKRIYYGESTNKDLQKRVKYLKKIKPKKGIIKELSKKWGIGFQGTKNFISRKGFSYLILK